MMTYKYVIVVTKPDGKYDCLLDGLYNTPDEAYVKIDEAKSEDKREHWDYKYRVETIYFE